MNRYILGFLIAIGLIVLIIVLIFSGGKPSTPKVTPEALPSYANSNSEVKMTIDGPITAIQNHNTIEVMVTQNSATYDLIEGYNDNVISSKVYPNTQNSYQAFLSSLYYAGFSRGSMASDLSNNTGYCSSGSRYTFELINNGQDVYRYWATNCAGSKTYEGNLVQTIGLFKLQIPDFNNLSQSANAQF
jgi:hypothetical protein